MQFKVYGLSMYKSLALTELHTFHVDLAQLSKIQEEEGY